MQQLSLLDAPPVDAEDQQWAINTALALGFEPDDPKWLLPDTTGQRAGYCLECDKGVWLAQIQTIHPDATINNIRYMEYNKCPTCQAWLSPF